mgnify:CR=1 FL=1
MVVMETPRLIFRRLVAGDLDDLCRLYADADVRRYFPGGTLDRARTRDELDWFLAGGDPDRPEFSLWATIHKPTDRFIGRSGFVPWTIENSPEIEIAYLLDKEFWRQGLGVEIARALVQYGFRQLGRTRLIAVIAPMNIASIKTAERAGFGFERDAVIDGFPCRVYAQVAIPR